MSIFSILLLILSLVGAIPDFIAAIKYLWDLISHIRDPKLRAQMRRKLRRLALSHVDQENKAFLHADTCMTAAAELEAEVMAVLQAQSNDFVALVENRKSTLADT